MPTQEQTIEWKEKVDGNKELFYVPEDFKEEAKGLELQRSDFNDKVNALGEDEIKLRVNQQNLLLKIREHRKKEGDKEAFVKDINFVQEALDVGIHIVHMVKPQQRQ